MLATSLRDRPVTPGGTRVANPQVMERPKILAPVDFSTASRRSLAYAVDVARMEGAELMIVTACPTPLDIAPSVALEFARVHDGVSLEQYIHAQGTERQRELLEELHVPGSIAERALVVVGEPVQVILKYLEDFDLAILGTHGRTGIDHLFMGSIAERVVRAATKPVITVGGHEDSPKPIFPPKKILVPIDFSDGARAALFAANRLAVATGGEVELLHVVHHPEGFDGVQAILVRLQGVDPMPLGDYARTKIEEELGLFVTGHFEEKVPHLHVVDGKPHEVIGAFAAAGRYDLIAMGTHGRTGLARFGVGSVAERVMRTSEIPVMTVRREEEEVVE